MRGSQVLVTNGGKHAVYNAFATLCDPGDEVLLPAPYWTTYPEAIALAGGVPVVVPTDRGRRVPGHRRPARGRASRRARRRCCSCRRPTRPARSTRRPRSRRSGGGRSSKGIWVVTDEIYEHLTYGDHVFSSMPVLVPELADQCVILNGVAKTYAMTGWRVGWMIGPTDVIKAATNLQSHTTSNVANVSQRAALAAVSGDLTRCAMMREAFARRGARMHEMLNEIPGVTASSRRARSTASPRSRACSAARFAGARRRRPLELAELLLEEAKVAIVPGEAFGAPGYARLSFALGDDDLVEGISRIAKLLAE